MTTDDFLWSKVSNVLFCTKEQYLLAVSRFDKYRIEASGELVGVVLTCGSEIHLACGDGLRGTRRLLREHLGTLIEQYGHATTSVPKGRKKSQAFVTRLGFKATHEDALDIHYKIERMHHV